MCMSMPTFTYIQLSLSIHKLVLGPPWIPKSKDVQVPYINCVEYLHVKHAHPPAHLNSPVGYLYLTQCKCCINSCYTVLLVLINAKSIIAST